MQITADTVSNNYKLVDCFSTTHVYCLPFKDNNNWTLTLPNEISIVFLMKNQNILHKVSSWFSSYESIVTTASSDASISKKVYIPIHFRTEIFSLWSSIFKKTFNQIVKKRFRSMPSIYKIIKRFEVPIHKTRWHSWLHLGPY